LQLHVTPDRMEYAHITLQSSGGGAGFGPELITPDGIRNEGRRGRQTALVAERQVGSTHAVTLRRTDIIEMASVGLVVGGTMRRDFSGLAAGGVGRGWDRRRPGGGVNKGERVVRHPLRPPSRRGREPLR